MPSRYILAPQAAQDLVEIWRYIRASTSEAMADRVESVIRAKLVAPSETPGMGHSRQNLTGASVKFFAVYSYLVVYLPETKPLQVVSILHGHRDLERILQERF
jgi:plasmid stabilization system protein ParE